MSVRPGATSRSLHYTSGRRAGVSADMPMPAQILHPPPPKPGAAEWAQSTPAPARFPAAAGAPEGFEPAWPIPGGRTTVRSRARTSPIRGEKRARQQLLRWSGRSAGAGQPSPPGSEEVPRLAQRRDALRRLLGGIWTVESGSCRDGRAEFAMCQQRCLVLPAIGRSADGTAASVAAAGSRPDGAAGASMAGEPVRPVSAAMPMPTPLGPRAGAGRSHATRSPPPGRRPARAGRPVSRRVNGRRQAGGG